MHGGRLIPLAHARHHRHAFAEATCRSRLALTAIAERTINTGGVALQTPRIEIAVREDRSRRRPKGCSVRLGCKHKGQTRNNERCGDPTK
jgi:hypothetical protein